MRIIIYTSLIFLLFTVTSLPQQPNFLPLEIGNEYQAYNGRNVQYLKKPQEEFLGMFALPLEMGNVWNYRNGYLQPEMKYP